MCKLSVIWLVCLVHMIVLGAVHTKTTGLQADINKYLVNNSRVAGR